MCYKCRPGSQFDPNNRQWAGEWPIVPPPPPPPRPRRVWSLRAPTWLPTALKAVGWTLWVVFMAAFGWAMNTALELLTFCVNNW